jgi:hypothetical protein
MRSDALPGIPTMGEFVPGYEASTWYGVGAPKATPAEIVDKLNKEINAGLADPKMLAQSGFAERGLWNIDSGPASLRLDIERPDHLAPLFGFLGDELGGQVQVYFASTVAPDAVRCTTHTGGTSVSTATQFWCGNLQREP